MKYLVMIGSIKKEFDNFLEAYKYYQNQIEASLFKEDDFGNVSQMSQQEINFLLITENEIFNKKDDYKDIINYDEKQLNSLNTNRENNKKKEIKTGNQANIEKDKINYKINNNDKTNNKLLKVIFIYIVLIIIIFFLLYYLILPLINMLIKDINSI